MRTLYITTENGQAVAVANHSNGKLAFWRRSQDAICSDLPARSMTIRQALAYVQSVYTTPSHKPTVSAVKEKAS